MLGKMPQSSGNDKEDITALYDYIIAFRKEINDMLFNLDDDNFYKITAQSIDTSTLIVGDNIAMGPNAVISWSKVSGRPNTTYIDGNGIYTGVLTAEQITAGTIDASEINVINLDADNITAGTLSADYISTSISQVYRLLSLGSGDRGANAGVTFNGIASISADETSDDLTLSALGYIVFNSTINVGDANFFGSVYGLDDSGYATQDWVTANFAPL